jgi:hypothetical protein
VFKANDLGGSMGRVSSAGDSTAMLLMWPDHKATFNQFKQTHRDPERAPIDRDANVTEQIRLGARDLLYLGPDRAGNLLEVVTVQRVDQSEVVIHAMPMRRTYERLLPEKGGSDG